MDRDHRATRRSASEGSGAPGFVVAIFVTLLLLFNSFAINMWLQYRGRGRGRWAKPAFAERVYLFLSLIAKSALAWQVYAGALAGKLTTGGPSIGDSIAPRGRAAG